MTDRSKEPDTSEPTWDAGWEGSREAQMEWFLKATPAQRLKWLEEALELAYRTGALSFPEELQDTSG